jgi:hypothetical protein
MLSRALHINRFRRDDRSYPIAKYDRLNERADGYIEWPECRGNMG